MNNITEHLTITVEAVPEDTPVRGNALASGDDALDKKEEDRILADLEWNEWAWCVAKVTAEFHGLTATEYIGGCSYESSLDFIYNSGYYDDMVETCLEDIKRQADAPC